MGNIVGKGINFFLFKNNFSNYIIFGFKLIFQNQNPCG